MWCEAVVKLWNLKTNDCVLKT